MLSDPNHLQNVTLLPFPFLVLKIFFSGKAFLYLFRFLKFSNYSELFKSRFFNLDYSMINLTVFDNAILIATIVGFFAVAELVILKPLLHAIVAWLEVTRN